MVNLTLDEIKEMYEEILEEGKYTKAGSWDGVYSSIYLVRGRLGHFALAKRAEKLGYSKLSELIPTYNIGREFIEKDYISDCLWDVTDSWLSLYRGFASDAGFEGISVELGLLIRDAFLTLNPNREDEYVSWDSEEFARAFVEWCDGDNFIKLEATIRAEIEKQFSNLKKPIIDDIMLYMTYCIDTVGQWGNEGYMDSRLFLMTNDYLKDVIQEPKNPLEQMMKAFLSETCLQPTGLYWPGVREEGIVDGTYYVPTIFFYDGNTGEEITEASVNITQVSLMMLFAYMLKLDKGGEAIA